MLQRSATLLVLFSILTVGLFGQGLDNFQQSKNDWEEINFEFNSSVLVDGYPSLLRLAELLQKHPDFKVKLVGNADRIGSNKYNDKLGLRRADMVKSFLVKYGAGDGQISTESHGKRVPESKEARKEGRFINRRVNMTVTDGQGRTVSDGSVGEAITAMGGDMPKKCCDDILARLDKLDDILKKLDQYMADNAGLKRDVAGLQDKVNKMQGDVAAVDSKVDKLPDENKVTKIVDDEGAKQIRNSRDPRFSLLGMNVGLDDAHRLTFTGKGRYFAPTDKLFGENMAVQADGEYMYFHDRQEGQFDIGLVNRLGNSQLGLFSSFKHVNMTQYSNGATLGQAAGTFDYLFPWGKLGVFGTKGFMDGGVIGRTQISTDFLQENYLRIVDQYGVNATVGLIGKSYLEGNIGYLRSRAHADRPGGTLRLVEPLNEHFAVTLEGGVNETLLASGSNSRVVVGFELGNFLRPRDFVSFKGPVPVDVPRIRYEVLSRNVRTGYSPPVAIVGPDQIGVPAGVITLDGSASYSPDNFPLTYTWQQTGGPPVAISGQNTAKATFNADVNQSYGFVLTVRDDHGGQSTAQTRVTTQSAAKVQIVQFQANPSTITAGQSSTIVYQVLNATSVTITGIGAVNPQAGALSVNPAVTTNYRITASNGTSEVNDTLTITVLPATNGGGNGPSITSFTANPTSITSGQCSTLNWSTTGATSVSISSVGTVQPSGSSQVCPTQTTTYVLTATNGSGSTTSSVTVTVGPGTTTGNPIVASFTANPTSITSGQSSMLAWQVTNATTVTITSLGNVALSGSSSVSPTQTTTYTLTATNANGSTTANVTVTVTGTGTGGGAPTITLTATPNPSPAPGTAVTISYTTTNANRVVFIGVSQGALPANGSVTVHPNVTTTYTAAAYNDTTNQVTTGQITVTVGPGSTTPAGPGPTVNIAGAPLIVTLIRDVVIDASASTDPSGGPLTYHWVSLDNKSAVLDPNSARARVQVEALFGDYLFQVTVTNSKGVSATGVVTVHLAVTRSL